MNVVGKWDCGAQLEKAAMAIGMTDRPATKNEPSQPSMTKNCMKQPNIIMEPLLSSDDDYPSLNL